MVGYYQQLNEHEFEQTLGDSGEQRSLVFSPLGHKESDSTWGLNTNNREVKQLPQCYTARNGGGKR